MELNDMHSTPGSRKNKKRVGRGTGSGYGKTAGRGENGQKSRSGYKIKPGFEGGQNPLYRRLPKRGFNNVNHVEFDVVNLSTLEKLNLNEITPEILVEQRIIKKKHNQVKILGNGELTIKVDVKANAFSKSAKAAIEKAGGKAELIED